MNAPKVFVAGTMQGAGNGLSIGDQSYRGVIVDVVKRCWPEAECFDPSAPVRELTDAVKADRGVRDELLERFSAERIDLDGLPPRVQEFRGAFREMTLRARECDLLIAYIPGTTPSMGTAMEMYQAFISSVPVVAVTDLRMNLSVISTADWILPDLGALESWLTEYRTHLYKDTRT